MSLVLFMKASGTCILLNLKFRISVQRSCLSGLLRLICSQRRRLVSKQNRTGQKMKQRNNKKEQVTKKMLTAIKLCNLLLKKNVILVMIQLISTLQLMLWFAFVSRKLNLSLNLMMKATLSLLITMKTIWMRYRLKTNVQLSKLSVMGRGSGQSINRQTVLSEMNLPLRCANLLTDLKPSIYLNC